MNTYALIRSGVVADLIAADPSFLASAPRWWTAQWSDVVLVGPGAAADMPVGIGWSWAGGKTFGSPPDEEALP